MLRKRNVNIGSGGFNPKHVTHAVAVSIVLAMTGVAGGDEIEDCLSTCPARPALVCASSTRPAPLSRVYGTFIANSSVLCSYTSSPGGTTATLEIDLIANAFNVPAGTRSTSKLHASGNYMVCADNSVLTSTCTCSHVIDGAGSAGSGNVVMVPSIPGRYISVLDQLFRMPAGKPAEETVITTSGVDSSVTTAYRKCSRVGPLQKIPGE